MFLLLPSFHQFSSTLNGYSYTESIFLISTREYSFYYYYQLIYPESGICLMVVRTGETGIWYWNDKTGHWNEYVFLLLLLLLARNELVQMMFFFIIILIPFQIRMNFEAEETLKKKEKNEEERKNSFDKHH